MRNGVEQHNYLINKNEDKIINMKNNCLSCSSMENTKIILPLNKDNVARTRKLYSITTNNYQRGNKRYKNKI
jgi:hypothetical protein